MPIPIIDCCGSAGYGLPWKDWTDCYRSRGLYSNTPFDVIGYPVCIDDYVNVVDPSFSLPITEINTDWNAIHAEVQRVWREAGH